MIVIIFKGGVLLDFDLEVTTIFGFPFKIYNIEIQKIPIEFQLGSRRELVRGNDDITSIDSIGDGGGCNENFWEIKMNIGGNGRDRSVL